LIIDERKIKYNFNIVIPTIVAYATFFLIYYFYQKLFFEYRWLAIIPFITVTGYVIKDNMREWKMIKQQG